MNERRVSLIYRNNQLFERYMPVVTDTLVDLGFEITSHIFPRGTDRNAIQDWLKTAEIPDRVLTDGTTFNANYEFFFGLNKKDKVLLFEGKFGGLDNIFDKSVEQVLGLGIEELHGYEEVGDTEQHLSRNKEVYLSLLSRVKEKPDTVYIVANQFTDHQPFKHLKPRDMESAEIFKGWFEVAGIETKVVSGAYEFPEDGAGWIIRDRHCGGSSFGEIIALNTPVSYFYESLRENDLITVDEEGLEPALRTTIQKYLIPKVSQ